MDQPHRALGAGRGCLMALCLGACAAPDTTEAGLGKEGRDLGEAGEEAGSGGESGDPDSGAGGEGGSGVGGEGGTDSGGEDSGLDWEIEELCAEADAFTPMYAEELGRYAEQDALGALPGSPLLFVGSSTIRRWEGLTERWAAHHPRQRGIGGAQLGELAREAERWVLAHDPQAIVVFAGTNDVDAGVDPAVVVGRLRCLRARVADALGAERPLIFVGITPSPARWEQREAQEEVNAAVAALAEADAGLRYADVPSLFLTTGAPPAAELYAEDGLHLSAEGYALFASALEPLMDEVAEVAPPPETPALNSGQRFLIDLGPSNAEDGEPSPSPDYLGQHWNNWYAIEGGAEVLPGERWVGLVDDAGALTELQLIVTGGFYCNGRSNGGLLWPDPDLLGDLAVGSATGDYFYIEGDDVLGGLMLEGLDPAGTVKLRLFAARESEERRSTRYTVRGAGEASAVLQTSGSGAGAGSVFTNDDSWVELSGLQPDPWGRLWIDLSIEEGSYGYLSLIELVIE